MIDPGPVAFIASGGKVRIVGPLSRWHSWYTAFVITESRNTTRDKGTKMSFSRPYQRIPFLPVAVFLLLAIGTGIVGFTYYRHVTHSFRIHMCEELVAIADLKVRQIDTWLRQRMAEAMAVSRNSLIADEIEEFFENTSKEVLREKVLGGLVIRRGCKRATVAVAHKICEIIFIILSRKEHYRDPGIDYERLVVERNAPRWLSCLKRYGFLGK